MALADASKTEIGIRDTRLSNFDQIMYDAGYSRKLKSGFSTRAKPRLCVKLRKLREFRVSPISQPSIRDIRDEQHNYTILQLR